LTYQIEQRQRVDRHMSVQPRFELVGDDRVIGSALYVDADGKRQERYQVITFRDGKIVDMQGCASPRAAERFARHR
jgi:hypothetical protein